MENPISNCNQQYELNYDNSQQQQQQRENNNQNQQQHQQQQHFQQQNYENQNFQNQFQNQPNANFYNYQQHQQPPPQQQQQQQPIFPQNFNPAPPQQQHFFQQFNPNTTNNFQQQHHQFQYQQPLSNGYTQENHLVQLQCMIAAAALQNHGFLNNNQNAPLMNNNFYRSPPPPINNQQFESNSQETNLDQIREQVSSQEHIQRLNDQKPVAKSPEQVIKSPNRKTSKVRSPLNKKSSVGNGKLSRKFSQRATSSYGASKAPPRFTTKQKSREDHHAKQQDVTTESDDKNNYRTSNYEREDRPRRTYGGSFRGPRNNYRNRNYYDNYAADYYRDSRSRSSYNHHTNTRDYYNNYNRNNNFHQRRESRLKNVANKRQPDTQKSSAPQIPAQISKDTGNPTSHELKSSSATNSREHNSEERNSGSTGAIGERAKRVSAASSTHNLHQAALRNSSLSLNHQQINTRVISPTDSNSSPVSGQSPVFPGVIPRTQATSTSNIATSSSGNRPTSSDSPVNSLNSSSSNVQHQGNLQNHSNPQNYHNHQTQQTHQTHQHHQGYVQNPQISYNSHPSRHNSHHSHHSPVIQNVVNQQSPLGFMAPMGFPSNRQPVPPQNMVNLPPRPMHNDASYNDPSQIGMSKLLINSPDQSRMQSDPRYYRPPQQLTSMQMEDDLNTEK